MGFLRSSSPQLWFVSNVRRFVPTLLVDHGPQRLQEQQGGDREVSDRRPRRCSRSSTNSHETENQERPVFRQLYTQEPNATVMPPLPGAEQCNMKL